MSTAVNFEDLWKKLSEGGGHSVLRDERKATYQKKEYIPNLKRASGQTSRLCLVTDLETYFNPFTGEPDDVYNEASPFRPGLAVSTVVEKIKECMKTDPELKAKYMKMAGVDEYEFEDTKCDPQIDYPIFKKFLKFRVFTLPVITINDSAITHSPYPQKYLFDVPKDPETDEYEGNPVIIKIANWFNSINFAKRQHLNTCWENAKNRKPFDLAPLSFSPEVLSSPEKLATYGETEMKNLYKELRNDSPISGPGPDNSILVYMFDLEDPDRLLSQGAKTTIKNMTSTELKGVWRTMRNTAEVRDNVLQDKDVLKCLKFNMDYVEVNMICPSDTQDPKIIGQKTRYKIPQRDELISSDPALSEALLEAHKALCLETWEKIDDLYRQSSRVRKYNESTDTVLLSHFSNTVDLLTNPWATEDVIHMNLDLISMLYPAAAEEYLVSSEADPDKVASMKAGVKTLQKETEQEEMTDLSDLADDDDDESNGEAGTKAAGREEVTTDEIEIE